MKDIDKTKEQLIGELAKLRQRVSELEKNGEYMKLRSGKETPEKGIGRFKLSLIIILVLSSLIPIVGNIILNIYLSDKRWIGIPSHSALETLGSFTALSLAVLTLLLQKDNKIPRYYIWVSCGLITVGILDGFDAFVSPDNPFVWLHSIAILIGGTFFAMIWLPERITQSKLTNKLHIIIPVIIISLGISIVYFSDIISSVIRKDFFSFIGGVFFLVASAYFIIRYQSDHNIEDFLFASFCLLNGWAGLLFAFSHVWDADWWLWHIIRLAAYSIILSYMFISFQRSEEKILEQAALLDKAHDAIEVRNLDHHIIYWNKGAQSLYGWSAEDVIGKNADELICKDKKESSKFTDDKKYVDDKKYTEAKKYVFDKGEWTGELCQTTKDGKEVVVESRWTLVRDSKGMPKSILIINTDITDKKNLEAQFLRAQRLESIGTLAGGIAHDLNNMMTPIMLSLEILKEKFTDEQSQRLITIIERNTQRGTDLIKQVLSFARGGIDSEPKILQLSHIISEIKRMTRETFPKDIEIKIDTPGDLWTISGDATKLQQVLMNLCVNARDAMHNGGTLSISAENIIIDDKNKCINTKANVGPYVVVTISDTGTGVPPEIMNRIFDPFFTTKEPGKGTGLGLSVAMAIVKSHGGFINVNSDIGKGSTFRVFLPAIRTEIEDIKVQKSDIPKGHGELILLVEDECSIREITASALERHGYKVISADDGADAITLYTKNKDDVKLILMDMMMPVMNGQESIKAIREINPDVKIIAVSGLADRENFDDVTDVDIQTFLPKPYTVEKLLKTIRDILMEDIWKK